MREFAALRCEVAGLAEHRVASGHRGDNLPHRDGQRIVPRTDDRHNSQRLVIEFSRFRLRREAVVCHRLSGFSSEAPCLAKYSAESSDTNTSANLASARGFPDSRTTASVKTSRASRIFLFNTAICAHRSSTGRFAQPFCASRALASNCGTALGDVRSNDCKTLPVAGSIEGKVSSSGEVAAMALILP